MTSSDIAPSGWFARMTRNLRFPQLFLLILALLIIDLMVPDILPFVDEAILGLLALVLGNLKKQARAGREDSVAAGEP